jgi:putative FmdB family regulatory protein
MPLYEFSCNKCEHRFEKLNPIRDMKVPETEPCPNCGSIGTVEQKVFSAQLWVDAHKIGVKKHDAGFTEVLSRIAEKAPGTNMHEKLSRNP